MPIKQIWLHLWPLLLSHINLHKHQRCSPFCYRSTSADLQQSSSRLFRSIQSQFIVSSFYCYHCCIIFIPRFYTGTSSSLKCLVSATSQIVHIPPMFCSLPILFNRQKRLQFCKGIQFNFNYIICCCIHLLLQLQ